MDKKFFKNCPKIDTTLYVTTPTGHRVTIHGPIEIPLEGKTAKVYLTEGLNDGIPILGADWINSRKIQIDCSTNTLTIDGHVKNLEFPEQTALAIIDDITKVVLKYDSLFESQGQLQPMTIDDRLTIETKGPPIAQRAYRAPLTKRFVIEKEIDDMLAKGIIQPSASPWSSPVLLVPKKDGTVRFCVDYRKLNAVTVKDRYPLPNIQEIFDSLKGSAVYSILDLKSGYWQLPVAEQDREKTAFICHKGQFEFLRTPYGVVNGPSAFQRVMSKILAPCIGKTVFVYIDDIIVYSPNREAHAHDLDVMLKLISGFGLTLKRTKCEFGKTSVEVLGYKVSAEGIAPLHSKVRAIQQ